MVTKSKLVHVSPRTYKSPDTLNIVIRITKVWRLWFFMQLLQLFTQWVEMLCIGFSPNAFARIPSPFAISTSGERNLSSKHRCHFGGTQEAPLSLWCCQWPSGWAQPGGGSVGAAQGVAEVWYLTKAIAASSLQNSSSTITPSSNVMWSMLAREEKCRESGLAPTDTATHPGERAMCLLTWALPAPSPAGVFWPAEVWEWNLGCAGF